MDSVEEVATPDAQEHGVTVVVDYVVSGDRGQTGALQPVQTPFDLYFVLFSQQLVWLRHATTASNILSSLQSST